MGARVLFDENDFHFQPALETAETNLVNPSESKPANLAELQPGQTAMVAAVDESATAARRLLDLGLLPGTPVRAVRRAPLGDPAVYELRGARLCLRREDAQYVLLTEVGKPA